MSNIHSRGFPTKQDSFYNGQDILYGQFNDVNFYIEDEGQENLYFEILKKLFYGIKITKIFPLNSKINVIKEASKNRNKKTNIYIVDKDFDDILDNVKRIPNLFYLNQYSIENYLLEELAIQNIIIEEKPKLKIEQIKTEFNLDNFKKEIIKLFQELICSYIIIQKYSLDIKNIKNNPEKFCVFNPNSYIKNIEYSKFQEEITTKLKIKDGRLSYTVQITKYSKIINDIIHIPGKYILKFLKSRISYTFKIQINWQSFVFRLSKNCKLDSLNYFKKTVKEYIL